jgi:multiple sugar transport system permease protein
MANPTIAAPGAYTREAGGAGVTLEKVERRQKLFNRICAGVLIAFALLWLVPLAWAVDTALKPNAETTRTTWLIDNPTFGAFQRVLQETAILNWFGASFITATLTAVGTVLTGSLAAFALSRMRFRYRNVVFWAILAGLMIPGQVLIVPQFREMDALGLLNTYWAVSLPQIPTAIAVFIFKQFFDGLPRDLEEAARLDGAGWFRIYRTVVLPLARPAVAAVAIFTFVTSWNDLLWPLLVLTNPDLMTVPVGLATVQGSFGIRYADTMASAVLGAVPLVAVFLLFQRNIVEGIAGTGLKG